MQSVRVGRPAAESPAGRARKEPMGYLAGLENRASTGSWLAWLKLSCGPARLRQDAQLICLTRALSREIFRAAVLR